jgi:hypothetical protein
MARNSVLSQNGAEVSLSNFLKERLLSAPHLKAADGEESNRPISKKALMQVIIVETERWEGRK